MKKQSLFGLMLVLVLLGMNAANAAVYGPATPSLESRDGPSGDENDSAGDLNSGNFFGLNDWQEIARIETNGADNSYIDGPLSIGNGVRDHDGDLVSGNWSLDPSVWQTFKSITLILHDDRGQDQTAGLFWTAWSLEPGTDFGHWAMGLGEDLQSLSHMTAYGSPVPVPAAVWLFGSGLLGLIGALRRKSPDQA